MFAPQVICLYMFELRLSSGEVDFLYLFYNLSYNTFSLDVEDCRLDERQCLKILTRPSSFQWTASIKYKERATNWFHPDNGTLLLLACLYCTLVFPPVFLFYDPSIIICRPNVLLRIVSEMARRRQTNHKKL